MPTHTHIYIYQIFLFYTPVKTIKLQTIDTYIYKYAFYRWIRPHYKNQRLNGHGHVVFPACPRWMLHYAIESFHCSWRRLKLPRCLRLIPGETNHKLQLQNNAGLFFSKEIRHLGVDLKWIVKTPKITNSPLQHAGKITLDPFLFSSPLFRGELAFELWGSYPRPLHQNPRYSYYWHFGPWDTPKPSLRICLIRAGWKQSQQIFTWWGSHLNL